jgi:hypothetical protein
MDVVAGGALAAADFCYEQITSRLCISDRHD